MKAAFQAFICALMISSGQVLWKIAINRNGGLINKNVSLLTNVMNLSLSPYMISGLLIYLVATVYWMYLLGEYEYSFIYPMISIVYVIGMIHASLILHESINPYKWIGVGFIVLGIFFVSRR